MKIIVLGTRGFPDVPGGIETHCEELYPRLVDLGCDVNVVTRTPYIPSKKRRSVYKGVNFTHFFAPKSKNIEAIFHTFLGILYARIKSPEILHLHGIGPSLLVPLAKLLGLKVVMTHHGPDYHRQKWGKLAKVFLRLGERLGTHYSDQVIVISKVIKSEIESKYRRFDTQLIYNGVTIPNKTDQVDYINSLGLEKRRYIIAVGRFVPEKGFHDLIDAFNFTKPSEYQLVLVGEADHETAYSKTLKKKAMENGIILTGFIKGERLNQILSHANLFVMPSYHEGLPIALLEAMSYNLKILVSDIPANQALDLEKDHYFPVGDISTLKSKIQTALVQNVEVNYMETISKNYDWEKLADKTYNLYKKVLIK